MSKLKIFDTGSYPDTVKRIKEKLNLLPEDIVDAICKTDYLQDDICSYIWDPNHPIFNLHQELISELLNHELIAFHNTRIIDPDSIMRNGLKFADDNYMQRIKDSLINAGKSQNRIDKVLSAIQSEILRHEENGENTRKNKICFIYDMDYYRAYDKFLAIFGGEFMDYGISDKSNYIDIIKMGYPYVVEFFIPFKWVDNRIIDISRIMLEDWIHHDIRKDLGNHMYDSWVGLEIPPENIIRLHKVDDYFPEIDDYFFNQ